jgi:hypothetical protein
LSKAKLEFKILDQAPEYMKEYVTKDDYSTVLNLKKKLKLLNQENNSEIHKILSKYRDKMKLREDAHNSKLVPLLENDLLYIDNMNFEYLPVKTQINIALADTMENGEHKQSVLNDANEELLNYKIKALKAYKSNTFKKEDFTKKLLEEETVNS